MLAKYSAPEGFAYDIGSGKYYQTVAGSDPATGYLGRWVTWFDAVTGEYTQVFYPDETDESRWFLVDDVVFALRIADKYYYPGMIKAINNGIATIAFHDGKSDNVSLNLIESCETALQKMSLEGNWKNLGTFYDCKLLSEEDTLINVRYTLDGVEEKIELKQLRAKNPPVKQAKEVVNLVETTSGSVRSMSKEKAEKYIRAVYESAGGPFLFHPEHTHITNEIPPKKLAAAIKSYARHAANEVPLLLFDETVFKSGKEGLLLTNQAIYVGEAMEDALRFELYEITDISHKYASEGVRRLVIETRDGEWDNISMTHIERLEKTGCADPGEALDAMVKILRAMAGLK